MRVKRTRVATFKEDGVTFVKFLIPCGKGCCTKCPHGPYWYARFWQRGKMKERYVGKSLTAWAEKVGGISEERRAALKEREDLLAEKGAGDANDG